MYCVFEGACIVKTVYKETTRQLLDAQIENALLFELYAEQPQYLHLSDSTLNVLCLGNSITKHSVREEVEWYSDWGMAASRPENDYCHVLEKMLQQRNKASKVMPLNIAYWERNLSCNIDSLIGDKCTGKNLIIIRLGENVSDITSFPQALSELVDYCENFTSQIIITGNFWRSAEKEKALFVEARKRGYPFVPLFWIAENHDVYPHVGDTLISTEGKPYTIDHDFIITHPNDKGMRMIAEQIVKTIE